jgi:hypothetical protein
MLESGTSGSVGGEGGNLLVYPAGMIGDRQRIAPRPVAETELALVVGASGGALSRPQLENERMFAGAPSNKRMGSSAEGREQDEARGTLSMRQQSRLGEHYRVRQYEFSR